MEIWGNFNRQKLGNFQLTMTLNGFRVEGGNECCTRAGGRPLARTGGRAAAWFVACKGAWSCTTEDNTPWRGAPSRLHLETQRWRCSNRWTEGIPQGEPL